LIFLMLFFIPDLHPHELHIYGSFQIRRINTGTHLVLDIYAIS